MIKRFTFEIVVGILCFISVALWGNPGFASFALFALLPAFSKKKPDERELQLFYRAGNLTMALFIVCLTVIHLLYLYFPAKLSFLENWFILSITSFMVLHGFSGLLIFKLE